MVWQVKFDTLPQGCEVGSAGGGEKQMLYKPGRGT